MRRGSRTNRILDHHLGIPLLNLLATFHRKRPQPTAPARIGVLCSPALGDTLLFSAVLADLRAHYPAAHITHFYMKQNQAAAELLAGADRRILIDLTAPAAAIRALRAQCLDLLVDFTAWQRLTAFFSLLAGAKFTAGFRSPGQRRGRGYDLAVLHRRDQHELENFRDLLRSLAIPATHPPSVIVPAPAAEPLPGEPDLIALHLWASGNRSHLREWPEANWLALARQITRPGTLFVITGAPADLPRITPFVAQLEQAGLRATAFVSPDGFVSLAHVLGRARLLVSVNTGVMHFAAILGTPTLALNGPTAGHRWGPWGRRALGIAPLDGSGGYLHLGFEFDHQPEDIMQRITVDQAVQAAQRLGAPPLASERWEEVPTTPDGGH